MYPTTIIILNKKICLNLIVENKLKQGRCAVLPFYTDGWLHEHNNVSGKQTWLSQKIYINLKLKQFFNSKYKTLALLNVITLVNDNEEVLDYYEHII